MKLPKAYEPAEYEVRYLRPLGEETVCKLGQQRIDIIVVIAEGQIPMQICHIGYELVGPR